MIGDKLTINGQEWEEIDYSEYHNEINSLNKAKFDIGDINGNIIYFKKVIKEVFPKVFEGESWIIKVGKDNIYFNLNGYIFNRELHSEDIEALKQALAFRDKMLGEKNNDNWKN